MILNSLSQEGDKLRDDDLYKFLADLKRPSNQLKKKCLPGLLKLDISPVRDQPKYCLTSELVKLHPYPGILADPEATVTLSAFPLPLSSSLFSYRAGQATQVIAN